jgi:hypothetical protein
MPSRGILPLRKDPGEEAFSSFVHLQREEKSKLLTLGN